MSYQERPVGSGIWRLRVHVDYDPIDGHRRTLTETVHGSKRKANERHEELKAEAKRQGRDRKSTTLRATITAWRTEAKHARSTSRNYDLAVKTLPPKLLSTPIDKINAATLRELCARVETDFGVPRARLVHAVASGALTHALRMEWIVKNPAELVQPPTQPRRRATAPTRDQVRALVDLVVEQPEMHAWMMLTVVVGARRSEVLALHWSDLRLDDGQLSIDKALEPIGTPDEKTTKTGDQRVVAFGDATVAVLQRWRDAFYERAAAVEVEPVADPYVFANDIAGARPWRPDVATKRFIRLRRKVGIECRLYDLRHYGASELLAGGTPAKVVGDRMGHKRGATTTDTYAHMIPASDRAAANYLEAGLTG